MFLSLGVVAVIALGFGGVQAVKWAVWRWRPARAEAPAPEAPAPETPVAPAPQARVAPGGYVERWDVYRKWRNWLRAIVVYGAARGFSRNTLYDYFNPRYPFASKNLIYRSVGLLVDAGILYASQGRETTLLVTVEDAVKLTRVQFGKEAQEFPFPADDPFGPIEVVPVSGQVEQVGQVGQAGQVGQVEEGAPIAKNTPATAESETENGVERVP
ncbi:MAG: hypothetical protein M5R40_07230 [Anaerolineae bacterium]|nr:hypothetical protein [Anaerolineae bacterium]